MEIIMPSKKVCDNLQVYALAKGKKHDIVKT